MVLRIAVVLAGILAGGPSFAEYLKADAAQRFVVGKLFTFQCFEGSRGAGRILGDGSVAGTLQLRGAGPIRFVTLPPGTLKVKGESVCASLRGIPFEPCFNVNKTDAQSFRGSVSGFFGMGAYCDFTNRGINRPPTLRATSEPAAPLRLHAAGTRPDAGGSD